MAPKGVARQEILEPTVIDEELIRQCIHIPDEDGLVQKKDPPGTKDSKKANIEYHEVKVLLFSFKNILKIDNLAGLDSLTKLQLDNNIIERTENLSGLRNLTWLDLSFNNIEKIEGLEALVNLTDLSLFNNRITTVENLDTLLNLTVLSIGNNNIKQYDTTIQYLRKFQNLRCLNLAGNPMCKDQDYKNYVLAFLKFLTYLDYRLVDDAAITAAREQYQTELQELEEKESTTEHDAELERGRREKSLQVQGANLGGVDTLFTDMTRDNSELNKLKSLSAIADPLEEYRDRFKQHTDDFQGFVLQQRERLREEQSLFSGVLHESRAQAESSSRKLVTDFSMRKKRAIEDIKLNAEDGPYVREHLNSLRNENDKLLDDLMEIEVQQVEQFEVLVREFEKNFAEVVQVVLEATQAHFARLRDLENNFHEKISEIGAQQLEHYAAAIEAEAVAAADGVDEEDEHGEADEMAQFSEEARALLQDKDTLVNALNASHDFHTGRIDGKEDEMCTKEREHLEKLVTGLKTEETLLNRQRVSEICSLVERNKDQLAKLDAESHHDDE
mmetsp:Transcript_9653/g.15802  ORF Transcript_9653/g.15802 Transcript_9653/m.15802 type:complete len:558 (+) Transcript_9653:161-1834(+)|eukprot:CAMPEP_0184665394 /NCGR_PEP_ID=MMETSP0308-20130426/57055_1 /TAXON_ID=38269 /ORGANISM="Gloeochaete witrockiana, Strain SAG 46.84" /LENGTH=557 /DNA_ID=CAMNT_0027109371 /DNA_START=68 /DNA_END=1741 /DNA_ORIENTATION=+